jgi:hypothetical protein
MDGIEPRFLENLGEDISRIANRIDPPAPMPPASAREAFGRVLGRAIALFADANEVDGRALALARGMIAKRKDSGRIAALARDIGRIHVDIGALEREAMSLRFVVDMWKDDPKLGLPVPLLDLMPAIFEAAEQSIGQARSRVLAACTVDDPRILAALGIVAATDGQEAASPSASEGARGASDAEPSTRPETAAERDKRELAEMLS